jgi:hypothetical protein
VVEKMGSGVKMKKASILKIFLGVWMILTAMAGYISIPGDMVEMTFISNLLCGVLFLADAAMSARQNKKNHAKENSAGTAGETVKDKYKGSNGFLTKAQSINQLLFLMLAVTFFMEFFITVGGTLSGAAHFNFTGPMFLLHAVNPAIVVVWYCLVKGRNGFKTVNILCAPLFVLVFLLFDYVRFLHTGTLIYGIIQPQNLTLKAGILIAAGTYGTMLLPSLMLAWIGNRV